MDTQEVTKSAPLPLKSTLTPAEELGRNTSRLSWLAAQGDVSIQCFELVFGGGPVVELVEEDGTVMGRGSDLYAALDDAMGSTGL
ncbi:hypothetical protein [Paucibacter sp. Y2R2-4]|uniref:hypothetical protein n=1 Tax=Paucibacter sp. Y2R2-4 TaxID=2893553 RepID=UPI0021E3684C|nr:hypothetical protein [Paucibacter sp. Y2R2-4]MCV2349315.1 hypothetical protein [Paucibacter sp. Y2R2-4]